MRQVTTTAATVATITAAAGGASLDGTITIEGRRYTAWVNAQPIGSAGALQSAAHQLAHALTRDLRRRGGDWTVSLACPSQPGLNITFTNRPGHGLPPTNPCLVHALEAYSKGPNTLERALEFAAKILGDCCR